MLTIGPRPRLLKQLWNTAKWGTKIETPLYMKDAAAVHAEVSLGDPEIRFSRRKPCVVLRTGNATGKRPLSDFFGTQLLASDQVFHAYSSRLAEEGYAAYAGTELPADHGRRLQLSTISTRSRVSPT